LLARYFFFWVRYSSNQLWAWERFVALPEPADLTDQDRSKFRWHALRRWLLLRRFYLEVFGHRHMRAFYNFVEYFFLFLLFDGGSRFITSDFGGAKGLSPSPAASPIRMWRA